jgi:ferric-dicitrate binding protein FerR (iron transport regulator)
VIQGDRGEGLQLLTGEVVAEVSPKPEGLPMALGTSDAAVEVVGTSLSLERNARQSRLAVDHGAARFVGLKAEGDVLMKSGGW